MPTSPLPTHVPVHGHGSSIQPGLPKAAMGNQNSRSSTPTSSPQSPTSVTVSHGSAHQDRDRDRPSSHASHASHAAHLPHHYHPARRRESIQALSTAKAQAAPPSATLDHAESHPTHHHHARPLSRGPSHAAAAAAAAAVAATTTTITSATATVASQLRAAHDAATMGNEQSSQKGQKDQRDRERERDKERDKAPPTPRQITPPQQLRPAALSSTPERSQQQPSQQQLPTSPPPPPSQPQLYAPSPQSRPVNVPAPVREEPRDLVSPIDPADASQDYIPAAHFNRPPRLPLPIEEEVHTPGSPIISPQDLSSPVEHGEVEGALPKRSSMLSTTTADDDDLGDEFKPNTGRPTVSTLIEWEGPGERVYVTGTFAGWNRKYRLHRNGPSKKKDALSAYVLITPGTHHLMFLVDNEMTTSDKLPTAVDYTNILVNYLEVSYDDVQSPTTAAAATAKPTSDALLPVQEREAPPGVYPPQTLPPSPTLAPVKAPLPEPAKPPVPEPTKKYHQNIPRYLLDLDAPDESSRFARANAMTNNLPTPPTLPGFLGKSILNGTTPMKDDSSVLIHPNHTVLNHLATSSIKDGILATSATTRYKQKFLTTIMYKPKEESGAHVY